jgi:hypothetical protein
MTKSIWVLEFWETGVYRHSEICSTVVWNYQWDWCYNVNSKEDFCNLVKVGLTSTASIERNDKVR